jgi:hypothetical protein
VKRFDDTEKDPVLGPTPPKAPGDTTIQQAPPGNRTLASPLGEPAAPPGDSTVPVINAPTVPHAVNAPQGPTRISANPPPQSTSAPPPIPPTVTVPPRIAPTINSTPPIPPTVDATKNQQPVAAAFAPPGYASAPPPAMRASAPPGYGPNHASYLAPPPRSTVAWWTGPVIGIVAVVAVLGIFGSLLAWCFVSGAERNRNSEALVAVATRCPAPATCTASSRETFGSVPICAGPVPGHSRGDVVIWQKSSGYHEIARVRAVRGAGYDVEPANGDPLTVAPTEIFARVCR